MGKSASFHVVLAVFRNKTTVVNKDLSGMSVVGSCMVPVTIVPYTFLVYTFLTIEYTATFCLHLLPLVYPLP